MGTSRPFSQDSFVGRNLIRYVVPIYEEVAGKGQVKHNSDEPPSYMKQKPASNHSPVGQIVNSPANDASDCLVATSQEVQLKL